MCINDSFPAALRCRSSGPLVVADQCKGGYPGIADLDPDHGSDSPEETVEKIDPSIQVKGDPTVIPIQKYCFDDPSEKGVDKNQPDTVWSRYTT